MLIYIQHNYEMETELSTSEEVGMIKIEYSHNYPTLLKV